MKAVIADSTCLIVLERIGRLELLPAVFESIIIPPAADDEFGSHFEWLKVEPLISTALSDVLKMTLGKGESEAIALAVQSKYQLITDDKQARTTARNLGIDVMGTLGLLLRAKQLSVLDNLAFVINDMESQGFHISSALRKRILDLANEE